MDENSYICGEDCCAYITEANWIDEKGGKPEVVKIGYLASDLKFHATHGVGVSIVEFYKLVMPGLILSRHIFKGLERPLLTDGNCRADRDKRVYTRRPTHYYEYNGNEVVEKDVPDGYVLQVFVSPNIHLEKWPEIKGWIDRWCWVKEDDELKEAPVQWIERYDEYLWTLNTLRIIK